MTLLILIALGIGVWAMSTGKIGKPDNRQAAALALGAVGLALLFRGKPMAGIALIAAGGALWPWTRRPVASRDMGLAEAHALLGVEPDADAEAIRAAHRRLIAQTHPDHGGTEELARQINRARDIALSAINGRAMNHK